MPDADLFAQTYTWPIVVTTLYFCLWYALLFGLQSRTKYALKAEYAARGETFDRYFGQDRRMLAADRAVANTHEQMGPFLAALWIHAAAVSPTSAAAFGLAYVVLRAVYPFLLGSTLGQTQSKRVFLVTGPCYGILAWLLGSSVVTALTA